MPCTGRNDNGIIATNILADIKTILFTPHDRKGTAIFNTDKLVGMGVDFKPDIAAYGNTHYRNLELIAGPERCAVGVVSIRYLFDIHNQRLSAIISYFLFWAEVLIHDIFLQRSSLASRPEFATNGMLPKCWRREKGQIKLFKGGTSGASNTGNEPYSEYYAAQVANALGVNAIS